MSDLFDRATTVFRDFNTVGDSLSGAYEPTKASVRALLAVMTIWAEGWVSNIVNAPTGDEAEGARYIVSASPSGIFGPYADHVAIKIDDQWQFSMPPEGAQALLNRADGRLWQYSSGAWGQTTAATLGLGDAADHPASDFALSSRTVTAGAGLSGGGTLTSDITLSADVTSVAGRTGAVTLSTSDVSGLGTAATHAASDFLLSANNLSDVIATTARANISAAKSGSNSDITDLIGLTRASRASAPANDITLTDTSTGIVYGFNPTSLAWEPLYGSLAQAPSLSVLDAACVSAGVAWYLNASVTVSANTTISAHMIWAGGKLNTNGHTVTLSKPYSAPKRVQVFDVSTTGSLVTAAAGQEATPEHFGWFPDGGDGANAVRCLNSFAGINDFDSGTYVTSATRILDDNHHLLGKGWRSQIKVANGANVPAISTRDFDNFVANQDYGVFPEDFSIENLTVNGNALTAVNDEGDAGNTTNDGIQIAASRYLLKNVYVFGAGGHGINSPVNNDSTNKPTSPYDRTVQNEAIWQNIHATRNGGNGINYGGPNDAWLDVIFTYTNLGKGLYVFNNAFAHIGFIHSYSNHSYNCHIASGSSLRVTQGHYRDGLATNLVIDGSYFGEFVLCNDAWRSGSPQYSVVINGQTHIGIAEIQTNNGESGINITAGSTTVHIGRLECFVASGTQGAVGVNYNSTAKVNIKGYLSGFADNLVVNNGQGNIWELSLATTSTSYGLKLSRDNSDQDGNFWKISYTGSYLIDPGGGTTSFNERDYVEVLHVNGSGVKSHNSILADQVCAVDSTGTKGPFTVAHGLVQAPNVANVKANFYKGGGTYARDWSGIILIESADATNITYYVNVTTASVTSGAKASISFTAKIGGMYV